MKKLLLGIVLVLVIAAGYFAAAPYLSVRAIQKGLAENDSATLVRYIDFPSLRRNLKEQLNATYLRESEGQTNFLSALMNGFKAKLVDNMVESLITPEGLANLMAGKRSLSQAGETPPTAPPAEKLAEKKKVFDDARFSYDSLEQFSVWLPNSKGTEMRLILQRRGAIWKLVNITLPAAQKS
jgi:Protein of unknown function (DUF2939).